MTSSTPTQINDNRTPAFRDRAARNATWEWHYGAQKWIEAAVNWVFTHNLSPSPAMTGFQVLFLFTV